MIPVYLWLIFLCAVFFDGGAQRVQWLICLLLLGGLAVFYGLKTTRADLSPWPGPLLWWPLVLLPGYALFQFLPLPLPLLRILSPARAELADGLAPVIPGIRFAPLSVVPQATFYQFLCVLGYVLVFLLAREMVWRAPGRAWAMAAPFIAVAALEAALGLWQVSAGGPDSIARGTYANRNHFAGLLEMSLPFAVGYAFARPLVRNCGPPMKARSPVLPAVEACAALAIAALLLAGIVFSLSRMGFLAALCGLFVMGVTALGGRVTRRRKWLLAGALAAVVVLAFVLLPTTRMIERFAGLAASGQISADTRMQIWRETLSLVAAYPVFGCGLGGYESAFLRYKSVAPLHTVDFAHNDYLQGLAELGIAGFAIVAALFAAVVRQVLRKTSSPQRAARCFSLACTGAIAAILAHSLTDFNLYMPANAMLLAWIGGAAAGLHPVRTAVWSGKPFPLVIDVEPVR